MALGMKSAAPPPSSKEQIYFMVVGGVIGLSTAMYAFSMAKDTEPCPIETFWSGSQANSGAVLAGLIAMLASVGLGSVLATTFLNANLMLKGGAVALAARHRARLACIIVPCALTAVFCWLDVTGSLGRLTICSKLMRWTAPVRHRVPSS